MKTIIAAVLFGVAVLGAMQPKPAVVGDGSVRTSRADFARDAALARDINSSLELARQ